MKTTTTWTELLVVEYLALRLRLAMWTATRRAVAEAKAKTRHQQSLEWLLHWHKRLSAQLGVDA